MEAREFITTTRFGVDTCINSVRLLNPSREVSLVFTNLQRAKSWLGKALKEMGCATPYPENENPASAVIEPLAEHSNESFEDFWKEMPTQTARVKSFRNLLDKQITEVRGFIGGETISDNRKTFYLICLTNSWSALEEAKMWLGWELDRIRNAKENAMKAVQAPTQPLLPL